MRVLRKTSNNLIFLVEKLLRTIGSGNFDLDLGLNNDNDFSNFLKDVETKDQFTR